jgi:hypothetical protein
MQRNQGSKVSFGGYNGPPISSAIEIAGSDTVNDA